MRRPFFGYYPVTQTYGVNAAAYAWLGMKGHNGVDYGLPNWTRVVAPHSGVVKEAGWLASGYGYYIKIENNVEGSVLAHLGRIDVRPGQWVNEGQAVALSDNTGNSTGPHLHWGYYRHPRNRNNGYDGFIFQGPYITNWAWGGGKDESEDQERPEEETKEQTFQGDEQHRENLPELPPDVPEDAPPPPELEEVKEDKGK